jgi:hypothetical protein
MYLHKEYEEFSTKVIRPQAGEVERIGRQETFYAGALSVLAIIFESDGKDRSDDEAESILIDMYQDALEFMDYKIYKEEDRIKLRGLFHPPKPM